MTIQTDVSTNEANTANPVDADGRLHVFPGDDYTGELTNVKPHWTIRGYDLRGAAVIFVNGSLLRPCKVHGQKVTVSFPRTVSRCLTTGAYCLRALYPDGSTVTISEELACPEVMFTELYESTRASTLRQAGLLPG